MKKFNTIEEIRNEIDKLDLDSISPLEALQILYKLKQD